MTLLLVILAVLAYYFLAEKFFVGTPLGTVITVAVIFCLIARFLL